MDCGDSAWMCGTEKEFPRWRISAVKSSKSKVRCLSRANAAKFMKALCTYPGSEMVISEAERHIREAHAERLSRGLRRSITAEDIAAGRAPRPRVLDLFAGGGAIPLEALRLGCDAYALDLSSQCLATQMLKELIL